MATGFVDRQARSALLIFRFSIPAIRPQHPLSRGDSCGIVVT